MHVHPVLPWNLKLQQPQLPRSEPDAQPNESSHLAKEKGVDGRDKPGHDVDRPVMTTRITIRWADDWHRHVRDGEMLKAVSTRSR
jgi:hypothetical protein